MYMYLISHRNTMFWLITGASKQLGILLEGESLLNDGAAIVLFSIFEELAGGHEFTGKLLSVVRLLFL